jgi:coenzyme F420-reducing hydrogenase alpha subunit
MTEPPQDDPPPAPAPSALTITSPPLARVEGEGRLDVRVRDGRVLAARLTIFEPSRFFEALLRGRAYTEAPDITSRICGICPVAYQMSAIAAMEQLCGINVIGPAADLRRLIYRGEWLESHALHVFLLHLPDFFGAANALELARTHRRLVERGLALKKAGNEIIRVVGGRAVHPINARVGGWYRSPTRQELLALRPGLELAREVAHETALLAAGLDFPEDEVVVPFVALRQAGEYAVERGRIALTGSPARSSAAGNGRAETSPDDGANIRTFDVADFARHIGERQVPHSTALQATTADGRFYLTGPLARFALNGAWLAPAARETAATVGLRAPELNPFRSILVRCVEMVHAADEALGIIEGYSEPDAPAVPAAPRAGTGHGATEAPRGLLYHRYTTDAGGTISAASIVPPTSQNQRAIEENLRDVVQRHLHLPEAELTELCERTVRNHDPCISCATHFLTLHISAG